MESAWYVVKVLPGKERSLNEQFNKFELQIKFKFK